MGNANHFKNYAKHLVDDPAQLAYGTRRFVGEVDRLCGVMDAQLSAHRHLAGDTIADIVTWPWASLLGRLLDEQVWTTFPNLKRWVDEVGARPAVQRGHDHHKEWGERQLTEEEQLLHQGDVRHDGAANGARSAVGREADRRRARDTEGPLREVDARSVSH